MLKQPTINSRINRRLPTIQIRPKPLLKPPPNLPLRNRIQIRLRQNRHHALLDLAITGSTMHSIWAAGHGNLHVAEVIRRGPARRGLYDAAVRTLTTIYALRARAAATADRRVGLRDGETKWQSENEAVFVTRHRLPPPLLSRWQKAFQHLHILAAPRKTHKDAQELVQYTGIYAAAASAIGTNNVHCASATRWDNEAVSALHVTDCMRKRSLDGTRASRELRQAGPLLFARLSADAR